MIFIKQLPFSGLFPKHIRGLLPFAAFLASSSLGNLQSLTRSFPTISIVMDMERARSEAPLSLYA